MVSEPVQSRVKKKAEAWRVPLGSSSCSLPAQMEIILGGKDGGHELKEKEVGDDLDSQFQQQSWPVSQNAKGINLVHKKCSLLTTYPRQEEDQPLCRAMGRYLCVEAGLRSAGHEVVELLVQDIQAEDQPLCGAMGRFLCVEAGLRSAGHEVVELLVQDTQEEEGHHLSHEEGR
ncbi:hypothetical protein IGI04_042538 [Brassica rapa subsp. trilocularis]|uniref:Uncharacterized protein n=1 Tax=Brassica rapa subsp. trilocularis TaxID=1813537 RepID=A0ABQ7KI22_BRACM|nr:hypothetical protein IGI04_042538 [Brassica rapa subsp. trilocularis]